MSEIKVGLRQIEHTDSSAIKGLLESRFSKIADLPTANELDNSHNKFCFAITASRGSTDVYIVGFCGIFDISWTNRNGRLVFVMVDKDKHAMTMQNHPSTKNALAKILHFGFSELGLHKIWTEVLETNKSMEVLEGLGFVVEGVRRDAAFKEGKFVSSAILSLLWCELTC